MSIFDITTRRIRSDVEMQEQARQRQVARAWQYYDGDAPGQLKVKAGDYNDNVRFNYPGLVVDTSVSFLFGAAMKFTSADDNAQQVIDAAWGSDEERQTKLARLGVNGGVVGHVFLKLVPMTDGTTKLVVLDPSYVDVDWASDDFTKVEAFTIAWQGYDEKLKKAVNYRQTVTLVDPEGEGPWEVVDERSVGGGGWNETAREMWDWPFPPIVHCQNLVAANEFYGRPDLTEDVLDLADRINQAASNIQKILRYHAHPKVFIYGYSGKDIDLSVDRAVNFPSMDTTVDILAMPTDLAAAFNMSERLVDTFLRLTRTPPAALGDPAVAALASSGLALKLGFMPLVEKTSSKRMTYGYLLNQVNERVLALAGVSATEPVELNWPSITPDDPMGDAQTALLQKQLGVSSRTLQQRMGFDPDVEQAQAADESQLAAEALARQMASGQMGGVVNQDAGAAQNSRAAMDKRSRQLGGGK